MKIDAHQHFWHYSEKEYGWIDLSMHKIKKDFLPEDLELELNRINFEGSIAVQARQTYDETQWLIELANSNEFIKGVVGWVDLRSENVKDELLKLSENKKFAGVRHVVQDEVDNAFMLHDDFLRGLSYLQAFNLTYDFLILPRHLPTALIVAQKFPEQKFVVDHISKPFIKDGIVEPWASDIKRLGALPNVYCKLSGMVTEADWGHWVPRDFNPYLDIVLNAFGHKRVMIGSDWPVCTITGTYSEVMSIVFGYINMLSESEQKAILGGNCECFYLGN